MTRYQLLKSNEYVEVNTECIIRSRKSVKIMRKEMNEFIISLRRELLDSNPTPPKTLIRPGTEPHQYA